VTDDLRLLVVPPDGSMSVVVPKPNEDALRMLYRAIGCHTVELIRLPGNVDMWVDEEGTFVDAPESNLFAAAVIAALDPELAGQVIPVGTVVLAKSSREKTVSLDSETAGFVMSLVEALGGTLPVTVSTTEGGEPQ
jgi:hypothetical protein